MFDCVPAIVIDGDSLVCGAERVRLLGIDAPELPGHCRQGRACTPGDGEAARATLERLVALEAVRCQRAGRDRFGRTLAHCWAGQVHLNCEMVVRGHAVLRYTPIDCAGRR